MEEHYMVSIGGVRYRVEDARRLGLIAKQAAAPTTKKAPAPADKKGSGRNNKAVLSTALLQEEARPVDGDPETRVDEEPQNPPEAEAPVEE